MFNFNEVDELPNFHFCIIHNFLILDSTLNRGTDKISKEVVVTLLFAKRQAHIDLLGPR
jgi:hypothetical protein